MVLKFELVLSQRNYPHIPYMHVKVSVSKQILFGWLNTHLKLPLINTQKSTLENVTTCIATDYLTSYISTLCCDRTSPYVRIAKLLDAYISKLTPHALHHSEQKTHPWCPLVEDQTDASWSRNLAFTALWQYQWLSLYVFVLQLHFVALGWRSTTSSRLLVSRSHVAVWLRGRDHSISTCV